MNLYRLKIFLAVARRLSYSRGGGPLSASPPSPGTLQLWRRSLESSFWDRQVTGLPPETAHSIQLQRLFDVDEELAQALAKDKAGKRLLRIGASSTPASTSYRPSSLPFRSRILG